MLSKVITIENGRRSLNLKPFRDFNIFEKLIFKIVKSWFN